ncbi:MAG: hypothetical protein B6I20_07710 [Bacteroidetes bacterium 4572_117]|nr:MAG: hypothetical protein B6I20_07710 [Bacteroidetes bacterium 4572_117]
MKTKKLNLIMIAVLFSLGINCVVTAQEYNDKLSKEIAFDTNNKVFVLYNLFGSVNVKGVSGSKVKYDAKRHLHAETKSDLEKAKNEIQIMAEKHGDTIIVYLKSPNFDTRPGKKCNNNNRLPDKYSFSFDFDVQVPQNAEIMIYTVNDGDIHVENIHGKLKAKNINGSINLENISRQTKAHTINGKVVVNYSKKPGGNSSFKTINGDINIVCDKNLSATIDYQSMNGEFYTNYDIEHLPHKINRSEKKKNNKTLYHLSHKPQFKIAGGKIKLSLETLNGDMTVRHL